MGEGHKKDWQIGGIQLCLNAYMVTKHLLPVEGELGFTCMLWPTGVETMGHFGAPNPEIIFL